MRKSSFIKKFEIVIIFLLLFQYVNAIVPSIRVNAVNEEKNVQDNTDEAQLTKYISVEKDENVYYIESNKQTENIVNDILITKDESKLNLNKVSINVQVPENKYTTILPDGNSSIEDKITFETTENGEYVFEFTDALGNSKMRVVHVTNIQNRKATKVPKVTATNGMVKLESDKEIEYSLDNKRWEKYSKELEYKEPLYARVIDEDSQSSTLKITINENGELKVENTELRQVESGILTNGIGDLESKIIHYQADVEEKAEETPSEEKRGLFKYISEITDDIKYSFSATNGEFDGNNFENNVSELTYRDLNNHNISLCDGNLNVNKISNSNSNIDYSVIYKQYAQISSDATDEENEKQKLQNGEIYAYEKIMQEEDSYIWKETYAKYAYIDSIGNLNSNIEIINKAKEEIEKRAGDVKYTKIVGDGITFYILTQEGTVYMLSCGDNGTYEYFENIMGSSYKSELKQDGDTKYIILKLNLNNIVNIYDSCTALTKEGKIVSLLQDNEEDTSVVQELQKQTDKYLVASHLGLKDGKLYNFANVKEGTEVTSGKIVESDEAKFGIYSKNKKTIQLFKNENTKQVNLEKDEIYIDVQTDGKNLPQFVDIAECRDSYLAMLLSGYVNSEEETVVLDYSKADEYAKCYAISADGQIWTYIGGYIVDTGINISFFGPTLDYTLNNTNWTNKNVTLNFTENTKSSVKTRNVKLENSSVSNNNSYEIEKNGEYTIEITDARGRNYAVNFNVGNIDKISPNIVYTGKIENGIANIVAYDEVDNNGNNAKSGIARIELTYETPTADTKWDSIDGNINEEGKMIAEVRQIKETSTVYVRAIDNAGNVSSIKRIIFKEEFKDEFKLQENGLKSEKSEANEELDMLQSDKMSTVYIVTGIAMVICIGILSYIKECKI